MAYDTLIYFQNLAITFFGLCLIAGTGYLIAGLVRPGMVGLRKRRWVVLRSIGLWFLGTAVAIGTIVYTHAHPEGPHGFDTYMNGFVAKQCAAGKALPGCGDLLATCARLPADTLYPACVYLREGPDAQP